MNVFRFISQYRGAVTALVLGFVLTMASPSFAQVPTLAVDATIIQTNLFTGANIMLGALAGIFILIVGMGFGGKIMAAIGDFIMRFAFG